jgi:Na+/proline symporter
MLYATVLILVVLVLLTVSLRRMVKLKSHADFMVADRRLSAAVLVFTLLCSWIGAGSLFGGAEFGVFMVAGGRLGGFAGGLFHRRAGAGLRTVHRP